MTTIHAFARFDSTSAAGAMAMRQGRQPKLVGCILVGLGTSTARALPLDMAFQSPCSAEHTTAGAAFTVTASGGAAIGELRRLSGFTWDQLARLFNVSRRSLHFWASGKPMASSNEEHLQRLLAVIRRIDRGSARANRSALLSVREDGSIPFDLLAAGDYERVLRLVGPTEGHRVHPPRISGEAHVARTPRPPNELVGALQDRVHPTSGRLLATKPIRVARRK